MPHSTWSEENRRILESLLRAREVADTLEAAFQLEVHSWEIKAVEALNRDDDKQARKYAAYAAAAKSMFARLNSIAERKLE